MLPSRFRPTLVTVLVLALVLVPAALVAQQPYDLSVLLPAAEEISPDAVVSDEVPASDWGGIAGYSRTFEHQAGLLTVGSSTNMFVEVTASLYASPTEARTVLMVLRGMDTPSLAELFGMGMAEVMGGSLDSLALERLEPPDVGESSLAITLYMDIGFMTMDMHMIMFQRGSYTAVVMAAGPPGQTYPGDLTPLAAAIDERMQQTPVDDLPLLAEAVADVPQPTGPSPDLAAARGVGVDLEILLTQPDELAQGIRITDETATRPLDGIAELSRTFEAMGGFTVGNSRVVSMDVSLALHDTPASALRGVLLAETTLLSCLDRGASEAFGADAVTVEMVRVPGLTIPSAGAHARIRADFFNAEAVGVVFAYGSLSGRVLLAGELDQVSMVDVVSTAGRILGRIGDLVPARRLTPYSADDSTSVTALVRVERALHNGDIDAALGDVDAIRGAAAELAATWEAVCRWGALWNRAGDVLGACDRAVALSDRHPAARDSRGMARALTGDASGAIEDLEAFAEWTSDTEARTERRTWVEQLQNGEQPLTAEVLTGLRGACWMR